MTQLTMIQTISTSRYIIATKNQGELFQKNSKKFVNVRFKDYHGPTVGSDHRKNFRYYSEILSDDPDPLQKELAIIGLVIILSHGKAD